MIDPIANLIAAADEVAAYWQQFHSTLPQLSPHEKLLLHRLQTAIAAAKAAAEARPEPKQCRPHCTTMATDCDYCRPEPAAEPSAKLPFRFRLLLDEMGATGDRRAWEALGILGEAFEALAREVRR